MSVICDWCWDEDVVAIVDGEHLCKECYKDVKKCNDCGIEKHVDELNIVADEYYCADCVDKARADHDKACVEHSNHIASTNAWLDSERSER